jgi:hypothetical protein
MIKQKMLHFSTKKGHLIAQTSFLVFKYPYVYNTSPLIQDQIATLLL